MKDKYDPNFDSPEARANFATRHIYNVFDRKRRRDELIKQFKNEKVVQMFPGRVMNISMHAEKSNALIRQSERGS